MTPACTPAAPIGAYLPPARRLLDRGPANPDAGLEYSEQRTETGRGARLLCRACGAGITDEAQRRSANGSHSHTRANPSGVRFTFGCFREAPGCRCLGAATDEHTWFAGCRWRIAACGGCGEHLGWMFSGADSFFGLILLRLVGEKEP